MKRTIIIILMILIESISLYAQSNQEQVEHYDDLWFSLINKANFTSKFYLHNELHIRRSQWGKIWQQVIIRPSLNYQITNWVTGSIGYSFIQNYPYRKGSLPIVAPEHNIWEQFGLNHKLGKLSFFHRYRLEQRWLANMDYDNAKDKYYVENYRFAQRFRYRLTAKYTIKEFKNAQRLQAVVFDEIWINIDKNSLGPRGFNQNWFYAGITFRFNKMGSVGLGYMYRTIHVHDLDFEGDHTIQATFAYNFNLYKTQAN